MGYLAAVLARHGRTAEMIDIRDGPESIASRLISKPPLVVGFSLIFQYFLPQYRRLVTRESNERLFRLVEESSLAFEKGDEMPIDAEAAHRYCAEARERLANIRNAFIADNIDQVGGHEPGLQRYFSDGAPGSLVERTKRASGAPASRC